MKSNNELIDLFNKFDRECNSVKCPACRSFCRDWIQAGVTVYRLINEDDEGVTEEIICPTCGTREVRKVPTKIQVKEKPMIPDNYVPAPRSISEAIALLESLHLPDGRTIFESDKFWERIEQYAQKYRAPKAKR